MSLSTYRLFIYTAVHQNIQDVHTGVQTSRGVHVTETERLPPTPDVIRPEPGTATERLCQPEGSRYIYLLTK